MHIHVNTTDTVDKDVIKTVKRDILWQQRNAEFWDAIKNWMKKLFGNDGWRVVYPPGAETGFELSVDKQGPLFSRYSSSRPRSTPPAVAEKAAGHKRFSVFQTDEP